MVRYTDPELAEFKVIVVRKLGRARSELNYYLEQILDITETFSEDQDEWSEGALATGDLELYNDLVQRQRTFIAELETALSRIEIKTFGICELTGALIEKSLLLANPLLVRNLRTSSNSDYSLTK